MPLRGSAFIGTTIVGTSGSGRTGKRPCA